MWPATSRRAACHPGYWGTPQGLEQALQEVHHTVYTLHVRHSHPQSDDSRLRLPRARAPCLHPPVPCWVPHPCVLRTLRPLALRRPLQGAWPQQSIRRGRHGRGLLAAASDGLSGKESIVKADVGPPSETQALADATPASTSVWLYHSWTLTADSDSISDT